MVRESWGFRGVDKIVDAEFQEFNTLLRNATTSRHLFKTKRAENARLCVAGGIRLGHKCAPFRRVCRFNNLEGQVFEPLDTLATISTTFAAERPLR